MGHNRSHLFAVSVALFRCTAVPFLSLPPSLSPSLSVPFICIMGRSFTHSLTYSRKSEPRQLRLGGNRLETGKALSRSRKDIEAPLLKKAGFILSRMTMLDDSLALPRWNTDQCTASTMPIQPMWSIGPFGMYCADTPLSTHTHTHTDGVCERDRESERHTNRFVHRWRQHCFNRRIVRAMHNHQSSQGLQPNSSMRSVQSAVTRSDEEDAGVVNQISQQTTDDGTNDDSSGDEKQNGCHSSDLQHQEHKRQKQPQQDGAMQPKGTVVAGTVATHGHQGSSPVGTVTCSSEARSGARVSVDDDASAIHRQLYPSPTDSRGQQYRPSPISVRCNLCRFFIISGSSIDLSACFSTALCLFRLCFFRYRVGPNGVPLRGIINRLVIKMMSR